MDVHQSEQGNSSYPTILVDRLGGYAPDLRLTDEELDFIINYDIKYRMGAEALEET